MRTSKWRRSSLISKRSDDQVSTLSTCQSLDQETKEVPVVNSCRWPCVRAQNTVELPHAVPQLLDHMVVIVYRQLPKSLEMPQLLFLGKADDVLVIAQWKISMTQKVRKISRCHHPLHCQGCGRNMFVRFLDSGNFER